MGDGFSVGNFGRRALRRPSYMTVTVVVALLASQSFGFIAKRLHDEEAIFREQAEAADRALRDEMLELGWHPLTSPASEGSTRLLRERHGIELLSATRSFNLTLADGEVAGDSVTGVAVEGAAALLETELSRYPRAFLDASRFRRVLLCRSLTERGQAIPSLPNFHGTLLLDAEAPESFLRRLVHHELFHFADYADDDQLRKDPAWERLNDRFFVYGSGGRFQRKPGAARFESHLPGFVSSYSTSALEEDKAEIFAFSISQPAAVREVAGRDPIVAAKVRAVKEQLQRSSPVLDGSFWQSVER